MYLNPTLEYQHNSEWANHLVGRRITPRNLVKTLGKHLNKHHPVRVKLYSGANGMGPLKTNPFEGVPSYTGDDGSLQTGAAAKMLGGS